jgi:O-antigen ligase
MLDFLKRKNQFVLMLLLWLVAGMVATPVAVGIVAVSVLLLKRRAMYAELILGFILILVLSDSWQPELQFAKKVKDIYLILLTLFFFFDRKEFRIRGTFIGPFIPFLIWSVFQIFSHPVISISAQKTLSYGLIFLVAPAYFFKVFEDYGRVFLKDYAMMVALLLIAGLALYIVFPDKVLVGSRYSGVLGNPNAIGLFCTVFFILFQSAVIKFPDLFSRNEKVFIYGLIAISVLLSGSRNTILSIALCMFFTRFYKISPWLGTFIVIVIAVIYQMVMTNLPEILQSLGLAKALRADTLESGSGRLVAWTFAWNLINSSFHQFMFGRGFGFDEYIFIQNYSFLVKLGHIGGVHNSYLALWLNTGIIGLILWLIGFFRTIVKAIPKSYTALPITYAVMFSGFFEAWLMGSLNPYTITFLFILSLINTESSAFAEDNLKEKTQVQKILSKPWFN